MDRWRKVLIFRLLVASDRSEEDNEVEHGEIKRKRKKIISSQHFSIESESQSTNTAKSIKISLKATPKAMTSWAKDSLVLL